MTSPRPSVFLALALLGALVSPVPALAASPKVFEERDGLLVVEAEHFQRQSVSEVRAWRVMDEPAAPEVDLTDVSGDGYVKILPDTRRTHDDPLLYGENFSNEPGVLAFLHYRVRIHTPGRHYVWVRARSRGTEDNSVHVGLNGAWPESGRRMQWCEGQGSWRWESLQRTPEQHCGVPHAIYLDFEAAGEHEILFSMREDGFEFDQFLLTTDRDFARPAGPVAPSPIVPAEPAVP